MPQLVLNKSSQEWLMNLVKGFGYDIDENGLCYGFSHMAMQAFLLKEMTIFYNRLNQLENLADTLDEQFEIDLNDSELTEYKPFLDGVVAYHDAKKYPQLFPKNQAPHGQSALHVLPLLSPVKLDEYKGINQLSQFYAIYSLDELCDLLHCIKKLLSAPENQESRIGLILNGHAHTIFLGYDGQQDEWHLIDPSIIKNGFRSIDDITDEIYDAFYSQAINAEQTDNTNTALIIVPFCRGFESEKCVGILNQLFENHSVLEMHGLSHTNLEKNDKFNNSILHLAAELGEVDIFKDISSDSTMYELIEEIGLNDLQCTPFSSAVVHNQYELCEYLLSNSFFAEIIQNNWRDYYFHYAISKDNARILTLLLSTNFFNINELSDEGFAPLHYAIVSNSKNTFKTLIEDTSVDVNLVDTEGYAPLHHAIFQEDGYYFQALLNHPKINVNLTDLSFGIDNSETINSVYLAVSEKEEDKLKLLLQHSEIDPNICYNYTNLYPIHLAVEYENTSILNLLINYFNIDVNVKARDNGATPLHRAVAFKNHDAISTLIAHIEININARDHAAMTPLALAIESGYHEGISLLLAAGADFHEQIGHDGKTPLQLAHHLGDDKAAELLIAEQDKRKSHALNSKRQRPLEGFFPAKRIKSSPEKPRHYRNDSTIGPSISKSLNFD